MDECPTSYVTDESLALVTLFLRSRTLRQAPLAGGFLRWPARLVDAFVLLMQERSFWSDEERRKLEARPPKHA